MKGLKKLTGEWERKSGAVYEDKNGNRIHTLGVIKKGGIVINDPHIHTSDLYSKCMNIMGQNNKRALMLFSEQFNCR